MCNASKYEVKFKTDDPCSKICQRIHQKYTRVATIKKKHSNFTN